MNQALFISVRTGSTRLPNKAVLKINNLFTIEYLIERVKLITSTPLIVLCTTTLPEDDILCDIAVENGIKFFRGSAEDKLQRWLNAAQHFNVSEFVNADGDDIFYDAPLADLCFKQLKDTDSDFIDGSGLYNDIYGIKTSALERVCDIKGTIETEFIKPYFIDTGLFKVQKLENVPTIYKKNNIRMTLDYSEDLEFFTTIISALKHDKGYLDFKKILNFINKNPKVREINYFLEKQWQKNQEDKTKLILQENNMKEPKYTGNELEYVKKVFNFSPPEQGTWCQALEKKFAEMFDAKYAIAMNSGTSTLHCALEALGVGYGDEVIVPSLTVIMNTTTVWQCNAIPVYADTDPDTFLIDPDDIERKITPKTKAIVVVSLYGLPCDMDKINSISQKYNIPVIEDHAQCFLSEYKGEVVGVSNTFSSWSFENVKHMSSGEGGILLTNDKELATAARKVAGHGYKNLTASGGRIKFNNEYTVQDPGYKRHDKFGINYRMSEFQAAIALGQLEQLREKVEKRKQSARFFLDELKKCDFLKSQKVPSECEHSYYTLGVSYDQSKNNGHTWQEFRDKYVELGGDSFYAAWSIPYLEPVVQNKEYAARCPIYENISYNPGLCPTAEKLQPTLMQFKTNYRNLSEAKAKAKALRQTIKHYKEN